MTNQLNCLEFETPESFIEYLNSADSDFLIYPDSFWASDILNTVWIVDSIKDIVSTIISSAQPDAITVSVLSSFHKKIRFQAFWVDKFFNPAPRSASDCIRSGPVCVICENDFDITYINNAYIEATWLGKFEYSDWARYLSWKELDMPLVEKIKYLSSLRIFHKNPEIWETSLLYTIIYTEEELVRVMKNIRNKLHTDEWYTDMFTMKHSEKALLWKALKSDKLKWNIHSAVEVNDAHPLAKRFEQERILRSEWKFIKVKNYPFWFYKTVYAYKTMIDILLDWKYHGELNRLFNELREKAIVWDAFIDESNSLVIWSDWKRNYFNREFSLNTDLSPEELRALFDDWWDFVHRIYWEGDNKDWVKIHLDSLRRRAHYFWEFYPIINGKKAIVTYDTFRYDENLPFADKDWHIPEWTVLKTFWVWVLEEL
ncbi:MAG: hypothetical protein ACD_3C00013G0007 [uncultured bacterium (gcode 4)]|uniref:Uncharacterized protein n=1 Tax=uncultured bacterium (gcode 4) TaxID=1234023 RepID=K2GEU2_9BACT|nr:MAG: hypothetical protein ACD_3C00013G0007 [uncultured bacterium (gcode 4)]